MQKVLTSILNKKKKKEEIRDMKDKEKDERECQLKDMKGKEVQGGKERPPSNSSHSSQFHQSV